MNIHSFLSVISFTITLFLGVATIFRIGRTRNGILFLLLSISLSLYSLGYSFLYGAHNQVDVRYWYKIALIGCLLIPPIVLLLSLSITKLVKLNFAQIFFICFPAIILLYKNYSSNLYAKYFVPSPSIGSNAWVPVVNVSDMWTGIFLLYCVGYATLGFAVFHYLRKTNNSKRIRKITRIILNYSWFAVALTLFTNSAAPLLHLNWIADTGHINMLFAYFAYYYATIKYHFLDVTPTVAIENIMNSAKEIIILTDVSDKIININEKTASSLGYKSEYLIGQKIQSVFNTNLYTDKVKTRTGGSKSSSRIELELITKEGNKIPVSISITTINDEFEEPIAKLFIGVDITDKLILKDILSTKEKILSIIAHDLRGPIGNALTVARTINEYEDLDRVELQHFMRIQQESLSRSLRLLEDLLLWAKSNKYHDMFEPSRVDLFEIIKINLNLLESNTKSKEIKISNQVQKDFFVYADPNMLNTVVRNLLNNAIKFTPEKGSIIFYPIGKPGFNGIAIQDNGIGIEDNLLDDLFSIDKSNGTKQEMYGGTGLGLVLCKDFVEKNKGSIWVESKVNEGSRFSFVLPAH